MLKQANCFKNPENTTRIDHILTNHPRSFPVPSVFETGLSGFHKLTLTVLKAFHAKHKPKIPQYRDFNHFDNASFRADLLKELFIQNVHPRKFEKFKCISSKILKTYASIKEKHVRCNQSLFMNKQLRKAIMVWTRLIKKYRKDNSARNLFAYKRQRKLYAKLLRKSKKVFYNNLSEKRINYNRKLWKTIKPNFTDNPCCRRQSYNRRKRCSQKIQGSFWENCRDS